MRFIIFIYIWYGAYHLKKFAPQVCLPPQGLKKLLRLRMSCTLINYEYTVYGTSMDKNFGFFGRYFAEISFFGEPRKEKCTEISFVRFFPIIADKFRYFSDFFRYFSEIFRFFHSFFLLLFCFKNLKKLFLVGFEPTQNA